jgi:hypothetical protein
MIIKSFILFLLLSLLVNNNFAQQKRVADAIRAIGEIPKIDGEDNDPAWQAVDWQNSFVQREPYEGKNPSQSTQFKILYNDNSIFALIRSWDTAPDSIVRRLSRRDSGDGDAVGIEFDSYGDKQTAFSFIVFASGVKLDKLITGDGEIEDESWDAIWDAKTTIDDKGWIAEIEIPLNQLRFNANNEQEWGLQVGRFIHRKSELSLWQPIPRDAPGWVHQFGVLKGIVGLKPKRQIEIAPYLVAQTERFDAEVGNPYATGKRSRYSGGIDAKIGLTNDITLDMTVFPDFGQVEADPSEVNLTAYETYFPEKRPFFIEGRNLFNYQFSPGDGDHSSENLFYSRRIGRSPRGYPQLNSNEYTSVPENTAILGAAKITGKNKNGLSFGIMEAITNREFAKISLNGLERLEEVEPLTSYFVGSLNKDYNKGNTRIGAMLTSTNRNIINEELNFLHKNAYSGGINIQHQWNNKNYYVNFKSYFSHVNGNTDAIIMTQRSPARYFQRIDAPHVEVDSSRTSLTGHGGAFSIGKGGDGHWRYTGFVTWKSPELEVNDVGYVRVVDDIFQVLWVGYRYWEPFSIFKNININFNQWTGHTFAGELSYFGGNINLNSELKNFWNFGLSINPQGHSLSTSALRGGPALILPGSFGTNIWVNTDGRKKLMGNGSLYGSNGEAAQNSNYSLGLTYKPNDGLVVSLNASVSQAERKIQFVDNVQWNNNISYLNSSLAQDVYAINLRVNYSITPDISIQFYGRPFIAKGKYFDFKKITNPRADAFADRFQLLTTGQLNYDANNEVYNVDENNDGQTDYSFDNPNFNFRAFQSNLVIRWEYRPGSTLFLVWSQGRESYESDYNASISYSAKELFSAYPQNVFLVKLAYRFY